MGAGASMINGAQRLLPRRLGLGADRVEIARLAAEIGDRARLVDRRDRDLHLERAVELPEIEPGDQRAPNFSASASLPRPGPWKPL